MRTRTETHRGRKFYRADFDSLAEFGATAAEHRAGYMAESGGTDHDPNWLLGAGFDDVVRYAREGWADGLDATVSVAEGAITKVEREHTVMTYRRELSVRGKRADLGRFASGVPTCMVTMRPAAVPRVGKVITLCASMSVSGSVSGEAMAKRGRNVAALAMALGKLGYATELYVDFTGDSNAGYGLAYRVCVKGAHDVVDPETIMAGYAHPGMLRALGFAHIYNLRDNVKGGDKHVRSWGLASPSDPIQDLPEGTIYLPALLTERNIPNADEFLLTHLRELGIITD